MANYIGKLVALITADTAGFTAATKQAKAETKSFVSEMASMKMPSFLPMVGGMAMGQIAAQGFHSLVNMAHQAAREIVALAREYDDLSDTADRLNVGVVELQQLRIAATLAGLGVEDIANGLNKMQKGMSEAAKGSKEQLAAFRELNLDPARLMTMRSDKALREIAFALGEVGNAADRTRLEMELFGRGGAKMDQVLREAAGGLDHFRALVAEEGTVRRLGELADALDVAKLAFKGFAAETAAYAMEDLRQVGEMLKVFGGAEKYILATLPGGGSLADLLGAFQNVNDEMERARQLNRQLADYQRRWAAEARAQDAATVAAKAEAADMYAAETAAGEAMVAGMRRDAEEVARIDREVAAAVKEARTEEERFADATREAHEWAKAGYLTSEQEAKLIKKAQGDLARAWGAGRGFEPAALARKGTAEEYEVVAKIQSAILGRDEQLAKLDKLVQNTDRLVNAAEKGGDRIKVVSAPP